MATSGAWLERLAGREGAEPLAAGPNSGSHGRVNFERASHARGLVNDGAGIGHRSALEDGGPLATAKRTPFWIPARGAGKAPAKEGGRPAISPRSSIKP
jgi:hypothetical protein